MSAPTRAPASAGAPVATARSPRERLGRIDASRAELVFVAALIAGAACVYTVFALRVGGFEPDEWYFTELARMIAHDFPAALWRSGVYLRGIERVDQLVLAVPYALFHTPTSYEVAHALQAVLYASTALPVWLLGRAAGLGRLARGLAATLVLLAPWAILSTSFLAEPAAYPAFALGPLHDLARGRATVAVGRSGGAARARARGALAHPVPRAAADPAARCALAGVAIGGGRGSLGSRLRALPGHLWRRHPIVTGVTALGILVLLASAAGSAAGRRRGEARRRLRAAAAGIVLRRARARPLLRLARGSGHGRACAGVRARMGPAHARAPAHRPRPRARGGVHARDRGLALSLLQAGYDERYLFYGAIPIALAFAGELDTRLRESRASIGDAVAVAVGAIAVILLLESVTWPVSAQPYDYLTYTAAVFYGKVVLGKLSLVHLPLIHPSAERLVQAAIVVVALAWIATGYRQRLRRPAAITLGVAVMAICAVELYYTLHKFTTGAAAVPGGPSAQARSWVDRTVPAGTRVGQLGIGLGVTSYAAIWRDIDFWNTSVHTAAALQSTGMPPVPLDGGGMELLISSPSGALRAVPSPAFEQTLPRYLLVPLEGTNPVEVEGTVLGHDPVLPVQLVRAREPVRLAWRIARTTAEGFLMPGLSAIATVYSGALAGADRCASFTLLAPPAFAGRWPYMVADNGKTLASGSLTEQERRVITVPLAPIASHNGRLASFTIAVHGHVLYTNGCRRERPDRVLRGRAVPARARLAPVAEGGDVREQVVHEAGEHARGAELLGLHAPPHADALVHLGKAREPVEHPDERLRGVHLQVVDVALQAVRRFERPGDEQVAGGEVERHLLAESAAVLARREHAHVVFGEQLAELLAHDAVNHLQQVVVVLGGQQHRLAVLAPAADREHARSVVERAHLGEHRVAHRRGHGAPDLGPREHLAGPRGIERDQPIERDGRLTRLLAGLARGRRAEAPDPPPSEGSSVRTPSVAPGNAASCSRAKPSGASTTETSTGRPLARCERVAERGAWIDAQRRVGEPLGGRGRREAAEQRRRSHEEHLDRARPLEDSGSGGPRC